jgi:hypothetical protein
VDDNKFENMWREEVVAYFDFAVQEFVWRDEGIYENPYDSVPLEIRTKHIPNISLKNYLFNCLAR